MMQKYGEEIKATTKGKNDYHAFVLSCFVSATPVALLVRLQRHQPVGSTELSLQGLVLATQRIHNILAPCNTDHLPHPSFRHLHLLADPGHHRLLPRGPDPNAKCRLSECLPPQITNTECLPPQISSTKLSNCQRNAHRSWRELRQWPNCDSS